MIPGFFAAGGAQGPAPVHWTPAEIPTQIWLDASDPDARTVVSGALSGLLDKSGRGQDFAQTQAFRRPTLAVGALGGRDTAEFDGNNHGLVRAATSVGRDASSICMAFLVRPDSVSSDRRFWNSSTGTSSEAARILVGFNASGRWRVGGRRIDSGGYAENTSVVATAAQWTIMVACFDYANATLTIRLNGAAASSGAFNDPGTSSDTDSIRASLGSGFGATNFNVQGGFAELVAAPDAGEAERIEGYFAHKWGLSSLLPAGHPYKEQRP